MRKLAWGAALITTTACLSVPLNGLAGSTGENGATGGPGLLPRIPSASAAEELPAFTDCTELLAWYVDKALPLVGPYGFGSPYFFWGDSWGDVVPAAGWAFARDLSGGTVDAAAEGASPGPLARTDASKAAGPSETGTNVQEAGVDEPDTAKTDGDLVYRLSRNRLVITDVTGDDPVELSRTRLPKAFHADALLLVGDTVLITGQAAGSGFWGRGGDLVRSTVMKMPSATARLAAYDVSAATSPRLLSVQDFDGSLVEARQYDDLVRLVLRTGVADLDFVHPNRKRSEREATRENRRIVRESTIEDWLPAVTENGVRTPLLDCADVRHPLTDSGFGTLSIVTLDPAVPSLRSATAVTTSGDLAYSSTDRLYVATPVLPEPQRRYELDPIRPLPPADEPESEPARTELHAFALDGSETSYLASGVVDGVIRDRWSLDAHDGYLRVATALTRRWATVDNAVTVLREDADTLRVAGSVRGLGPEEEIKSVRWFDDLAVVVTFRQVDPLYTVDLSDPARPRVLGELKIPGFSSYLHPVGGDRLLGAGSSATSEGRVRGAQLASFDIADLRDPRRLSVLEWRDSDLPAAWDPHAFTFIGDTAWTLISDWRDGGTRMLRVELATDGTLREVASYPASYGTRALPVSGDRVALVGDDVRLLSD